MELYVLDDVALTTTSVTALCCKTLLEVLVTAFLFARHTTHAEHVEETENEDQDPELISVNLPSVLHSEEHWRLAEAIQACRFA
jgi:hypothetical protein